MSINDITWAFRIGLFVLPPLAFWVTKRICLSLQRRDRDLALHSRESGRIIRGADGSFHERHDALTDHERWILVQHEPVAPLQLTPDVDENGVARPAARKDRLRAKLSHFYYKDAVNPVTPAELAAAHHDGHTPRRIEAPFDYEGIEGDSDHTPGTGGVGADTDAGRSEASERGIGSASRVRE